MRSDLHRAGERKTPVKRASSRSLYSRNLKANTDTQEFLGWLEKWIGADRFKRIPKEKTRHGSAMINSFEVNKLQFGGEFQRRYGCHRVATCHRS